MPQKHKNIIPILALLLLLYLMGPIHSQISIQGPADTDEDGIVSDYELLDYIDLWVLGNVTDYELLDAIDEWANPTTTTLTTTTTSTSTSSTTTTCLGEGERIMFEPYQVYEVCCPGLTMLFDALPDVDPITGEDSCVYPGCPCYVCTNCGNGICEDDMGENWCNCPEDCLEPEEVPCTTNDECGTDRCWMEDNICHEMSFQCYDNGQCSDIAATSFVNYSCVDISCVPPTTSTSITSTTPTSTTTTTTILKLAVDYSPAQPPLNEPLIFYVRPYGNSTALVEDSYLYIQAPSESTHTLYPATNGTYTTQAEEGTYVAYATKEGWTNSDVVYIISACECW